MKLISVASSIDWALNNGIVAKYYVDTLELRGIFG